MNSKNSNNNQSQKNTNNFDPHQSPPMTPCLSTTSYSQGQMSTRNFDQNKHSGNDYYDNQEASLSEKIHLTTHSYFSHYLPSRFSTMYWYQPKISTSGFNLNSNVKSSTKQHKSTKSKSTKSKGTKSSTSTPLNTYKHFGFSPRKHTSSNMNTKQNHNHQNTKPSPNKDSKFSRNWKP
jgi:hypothetical protein